MDDTAANTAPVVAPTRSHRPRLLYPIALAMALAIPGVCVASTPSPPGILAPLHDPTAIDGCAWSATASDLGEGYVFLAEYDESRVLMNLHGADTELTRVSGSGSLDAIGSVAVSEYRAEDGTTVLARFRTTWLCPEDGSGGACEVTRFEATFDVDSGGQHQRVMATGVVGC